ncbi:XRE family transcriptional regulator [Faecalicatena contorta]|uniref:helix-turn-helix domain-containing protein n=1 Tax=Faecalicatena contorta TaxID=39482 RepID=UPI00129E96E1|nr:helix-turn-helix transcriptional regulator [Faecalicatena contorta]MRM89641.1 XRE family transcriptional regulator [Faecalicatena contorta]
MKADRGKLEIAMAKACMNTEDLQKKSDMPRPTVNKVISGRNVRPGTIGKIARALNVDVTEIMEIEK